MKQIVKKVTLFVALCVIATAYCYAQEPSKVEIRVGEIVKQYKNVKGVDCTVVTKGSGLGLLKMVLSKQMGKEFLKGVTGITIIDYSEASTEVCQAMHKELDTLLPLLTELNLNQDKNSAENTYARSFILPLDDGTVSDFVLALESENSKTIMYMSGKINFNQ